MKFYQCVIFCITGSIVFPVFSAGWTDWSSWSSCSSTCGEGTRKRVRTCLGQSFQVRRKLLNVQEGKDLAACDGEYSQTELCPLVAKLCSVNGNWGGWSAWSACTVTCGKGSKSRSRQCNNPTPSNGGQPCAGSATNTMSCITQLCPAVNGGWSVWQTWTTCSVSCGGSIQHRSRTCNNPSPKNGGTMCSGYNRESRLCNTKPCSVNGEWSVWSAWTTCSVSCGSSIQRRSRTCNNPIPKNGGTMCSGYNRESRLCNTQPCSANETLGSWLPWNACTLTCGIGTKSRFRRCNSPTSCVGNLSETNACAVQQCAVLTLQQTATQKVQSEPLLKGIIGGLALILFLSIVALLFLFWKYKGLATAKKDERSERNIVESTQIKPSDKEYEEMTPGKANLGQTGKKNKQRRCDNYEMLEKKSDQMYDQISVKDIRNEKYVNVEY